MNFGSVTKELDELKAQYDQKIAELRDSGAVKELFKDFFAANPQFTGIYWVQYIPSFNDGDPCVFSVCDPYIATGPIDIENFDGGSYEPDEDDPESESNWKEAYNYYGTHVGVYEDGKYTRVPNTNIVPAVKELANFICTHGDMMETLFGSNAWVLVTPEKIVSDYYDCGY